MGASRLRPEPPGISMGTQKGDATQLCGFHDGPRGRSEWLGLAQETSRVPLSPRCPIGPRDPRPRRENPAGVRSGVSRVRPSVRPASAPTASSPATAAYAPPRTGRVAPTRGNRPEACQPVPSRAGHSSITGSPSGRRPCRRGQGWPRCTAGRPAGGRRPGSPGS
jgi:hypothetical protein